VAQPHRRHLARDDDRRSIFSELGGGSLGNLWMYIVAPLAGGALAAAVFGLQEREPVNLHAEPARTPESRPA
jgi:hypothetical protein